MVVDCGLRDLRDYKAASGGDPTRLGSSSPFNVKINVKIESLKLGNFEPAQVEALYARHTAETGQAFSPEAVARAIELTGCQPWLVNALAREVIEKMKSVMLRNSHLVPGLVGIACWHGYLWFRLFKNTGRSLAWRIARTVLKNSRIRYASMLVESPSTRPRYRAKLFVIYCPPLGPVLLGSQPTSAGLQ